MPLMSSRSSCSDLHGFFGEHLLGDLEFSADIAAAHGIDGWIIHWCAGRWCDDLAGILVHAVDDATGGTAVSRTSVPIDDLLGFLEN